MLHVKWKTVSGFRGLIMVCFDYFTINSESVNNFYICTDQKTLSASWWALCTSRACYSPRTGRCLCTTILLLGLVFLVFIVLLSLLSLYTVWWRQSWHHFVSWCSRTSTWCCSICHYQLMVELTTPLVRKRRSSSSTLTALALYYQTLSSSRWWSHVWWWCTTLREEVVGSEICYLVYFKLLLLILK